MNFDSIFKPNKTPAGIINERAFGGTYFKDMYSGIMVSGIVIAGKNLIFYVLKNWPLP